MTVSADDLDRILDAVETIDASLSVLAEKQSLSRDAYRADRESRDVVDADTPAFDSGCAT